VKLTIVLVEPGGARTTISAKRLTLEPRAKHRRRRR
jgi:hypothetical protein